MLTIRPRLKRDRRRSEGSLSKRAFVPAIALIDFATPKFNNVTTMKYVGMRQLKAQLARYLRAVEAGDSLTITVRKRPVAKVIPVRARSDDDEEALNSLVEKGLLRPARRRPRPPKRALKVRNVGIAEAVLEDRGAIL